MKLTPPFLLSHAQSESGAEFFKKAMDEPLGIHKKRSMILVTGARCNFSRVKMAKSYEKMYGSSIIEDIKKSCRDDEFSQVICDMYEDIHIRCVLFSRSGPLGLWATGLPVVYSA